MSVDCKHWSGGKCGLGLFGSYPSPGTCMKACDQREPGGSRGLGDTIAKITTAVGIKPCGGCKKRQAALNRLVPYKPTEAG